MVEEEQFKPRIVTQLVFAILLLVGASRATPAHAEGKFVLKPGAAETLSARLGLEKKLPGGIQLEAIISKDHAVVRGKNMNGEPVLAVTLVHPSLVKDAALRFDDLGLRKVPGPTQEGAFEALLVRLRGDHSPVLWHELPAQQARDPERWNQIRRWLDLASYKGVLGLKDEAAAAMAKIPKELPPPLVIDVAILLKELGRTDEMKARLAEADLTGFHGLAAGLLVGKSVPMKRLRELVSHSDRPCRLQSLLATLGALGRFDDLLELAGALRKRDASCTAAWDAEFNETIRRGQREKGLEIAKAAYDMAPKDRMARLRLGGALQRLERFPEAVEIFEAIARDFPGEKGILRLTLGVMLRDVEGRRRHEERLGARLAKDPSDTVSQFLRGVLHHYENEFEASNRLLGPLEKKLAYEQRIDIYRAMNDFNLGLKKEALARLNAAAEVPIPDPDIFYCRAEILRDEKREQAIADLERYLATSERSSVSNPSKQARVKKMRDDLKRCLNEGTKTCASEWEHPRAQFSSAGKRSESPSEESRNYWPYAGLLAALLFLLFLWRRRMAD